MAENKRGIILNIGKPGDLPQISIKDSYFAAVSRLDCPTCYPNGEVCSSLYGIILPIATVNSKDILSSTTDSLNFNPASDSLFYANTTISGNHFANWNEISNLGCKSNYLLKTNENAEDYTPITILKNNQVSNSGGNPQTIALIDKPNPANLNACGGTSCTGLNNVLIIDADGSIAGSPSTIIS